MTFAKLRAKLLIPSGDAVIDVGLPELAGIPAPLTIPAPEIVETPDSLRIRGATGPMFVDALYAGAGQPAAEISLRGVTALEQISFSPLSLGARELHFNSRPHPRWEMRARLELGSLAIPLAASPPFPPWNLALPPGSSIELKDPALLDSVLGGPEWRQSLPPGLIWRLVALLITWVPAVDRVTSVFCTLACPTAIPVDGITPGVTLESLRFASTASPNPYVTAGGTLCIGRFRFEATLNLASRQLTASAGKKDADWNALRESGLLAELRPSGEVRATARFTDVFLEMEYRFSDGRMAATLLRAAATGNRGREENWERRDTL